MRSTERWKQKRKRLIKSLNKTENANDSKLVVAKPEDGEKENASYKIKPLVSVDIALHKEETIVKKFGKVQKVTPIGT